MDYNYSLMTTGQTCTPNAGLSKSRFTSGKKHRLTFTNGASEGLQRFTIDGHNMTVTANEFVPVVPYETNMVTLRIGQRTDVIVEASGPPNSSFWMHADIPGPCSVSNPLSFHALAAIYYGSTVTTTAPNTTAHPYDASLCSNDPLNKTTSFFPFPRHLLSSRNARNDIMFGPNLTGYDLFSMNGQTFRANYKYPVLFLANQGNTSYPNDPQWNVYNFSNNASVRLIVHNKFGASHPMHLRPQLQRPQRKRRRMGRHHDEPAKYPAKRCTACARWYCCGAGMHSAAVRDR